MKLTVALLTYNRPHYLRFAIESILNQTFLDFEFLILDNGSTFETKEVINSFSDKRIKYIRNEINDRKFANLPFDIAQGEYLIITHDDDVMEETFLQREIEILDANPDVSLVGSCVSHINNDGTIIKKNASRKWEDLIFKQFGFIKSYCYNGNFLPCPTLMIRLSVVKENKFRYNLEVGPMADLYLSFQFNLLTQSIYLISDPLYRYRTHNNQDGFLNRIVMEKKIVPHIKGLLLSSGCINLAKEYEQSAYSQTMAFYINRFVSNRMNYSDFKSNINELCLNGLKLNWLSVYWGLRGILQGILKR